MKKRFTPIYKRTTEEHYNTKAGGEIIERTVSTTRIYFLGILMKVEDTMYEWRRLEDKKSKK